MKEKNFSEIQNQRSKDNKFSIEKVEGPLGKISLPNNPTGFVPQRLPAKIGDNRPRGTDQGTSRNMAPKKYKDPKPPKGFDPRKPHCSSDYDLYELNQPNTTEERKDILRKRLKIGPYAQKDEESTAIAVQDNPGFPQTATAVQEEIPSATTVAAQVAMP